MTPEVGWALGTFSAIFFVVDPIAVVPIFLAITPKDSDAARRSMAFRASVIAMVVLIVFTFGGQALFRVFGVTLPAFKVAGGILLLLTALDQLRSHESETRTTGEEIAESQEKDDVAVVPLAMPLLAGPGSIATVIVLAGGSDAPWQMGVIAGSIALTCGIAWILLRTASWVNRMLGATGRAVLLRISGLLLAAVAVQFVLTGIAEAFPFLVR